VGMRGAVSAADALAATAGLRIPMEGGHAVDGATRTLQVRTAGPPEEVGRRVAADFSPLVAFECAGTAPWSWCAQVAFTRLRS